MRLLFFTFIAANIIVGCQSTSQIMTPPQQELIPPSLTIDQSKDKESVDNYLKNMEMQSTQRNIYWLTTYKRAQLWMQEQPQKSCPLFANLAQDKLFPLYFLAQIRALQSCTETDIEKYQLSIHFLENPPDWLKNEALDILLKLAKQNKDIKKEIELLLKKSKLNISKKEKLSFAQSALLLATKTHDNDMIVKLNKRISRLSPRFIQKPKYSDYLRVAYDYRITRDFKKSLYYYKKVVNSSHGDFNHKITAMKGLRKTYKLMANDPLYIRTTEKLAGMIEKKFKKSKRFKKNKSSQYLSSQLLLARTYWTKSKIRKAKKTLLSTIKKIKNYHSLEKVYLILGRMAEEKKDYTKAIYWFDLALQENFNNDSFRETLMWYKAWSYRKLNQINQSSLLLAELSTQTKNPYTLPKYKFWHAKSLEQLQDFEHSKQVYQDLIDDDPLGYYSILARRETHQQLRLPADNRSIASSSYEQQTPQDFEKHVDISLLDWLIAVNENKVATSYLNFIAKYYRKKGNINEKTWVALFNYYAKAGNYLSLFSELGNLSAEQRKTILIHNPHLIFPKPWASTVTDSASQFGIHPEYIYAIMRQESAFDPRARSHMDAFGLMQLLPKVAKKSANNNGLPFKEADDLYKPYIVIPIGAAHLRHLLDKNNGQFILATASYNANRKAIQNWLKTRFNGDPLEFIEDIPYEETRNYIKLVLRNYIFYSIFNSKDKVISFPEWALNLSYESES